MSIKSVKPSGGSRVFCLPTVLAAAGLPWTLGGSSTEPQLTASPPRAQRDVTVRSRIPRLLAFDALVKRSLAID